VLVRFKRLPQVKAFRCQFECIELAGYNLTVYQSHGRDGHSYLWDETKEKRGTNEIGSALLLYIQKLPNTVTHVSTRRG